MERQRGQRKLDVSKIDDSDEDEYGGDGFAISNSGSTAYYSPQPSACLMSLNGPDSSPGILPTIDVRLNSKEKSSHEDGLCFICYCNTANCCIMECGHGGVCFDCAQTMAARRPSVCPICRGGIAEVLRLSGKFITLQTGVTVTLSEESVMINGSVHSQALHTNIQSSNMNIVDDSPVPESILQTTTTHQPQNVSIDISESIHDMV